MIRPDSIITERRRMTKKTRLKHRQVKLDSARHTAIKKVPGFIKSLKKISEMVNGGGHTKSLSKNQKKYITLQKGVYKAIGEMSIDDRCEYLQEIYNGEGKLHSIEDKAFRKELKKKEKKGMTITKIVMKKSLSIEFLLNDFHTCAKKKNRVQLSIKSSDKAIIALAKEIKDSMIVIGEYIYTTPDSIVNAVTMSILQRCKIYTGHLLHPHHTQGHHESIDNIELSFHAFLNQYSVTEPIGIALKDTIRFIKDMKRVLDKNILPKEKLSRMEKKSTSIRNAIKKNEVEACKVVLSILTMKTGKDIAVRIMGFASSYKKNINKLCKRGMTSSNLHAWPLISCCLINYDTNSSKRIHEQNERKARDYRMKCEMYALECLEQKHAYDEIIRRKLFHKVVRDISMIKEKTEMCDRYKKCTIEHKKNLTGVLNQLTYQSRVLLEKKSIHETGKRWRCYVMSQIRKLSLKKMTDTLSDEERCKLVKLMSKLDKYETAAKSIEDNQSL